MMKMKTCTICKIEKPVTEFYRYKFYTKSECKECARNRSAKWKQENPEQAAKASQKWHQENKDRARMLGKRWRQENRERSRELTNKNNRVWNKAHPEKLLINWWNREMKMRANGGTFTAKEWLQLQKDYNGRCACCHKKTKLTIDHVIPVSKGGRNDITNIQPLCMNCNHAKFTNSTDYRK